MQLLVNIIYVDAVKIAAQINPQQVVRVLCMCGVLYVTAINGLVKILTGRQSACQELADSAPLCLLMELIKTSVVNFVPLVGNHKD